MRIVRRRGGGMRIVRGEDGKREGVLCPHRKGERDFTFLAQTHHMLEESLSHYTYLCFHTQKRVSHLFFVTTHHTHMLTSGIKDLRPLYVPLSATAHKEDSHTHCDLSES